MGMPVETQYRLPHLSGVRRAHHLFQPNRKTAALQISAS